MTIFSEKRTVNFLRLGKPEFYVKGGGCRQEALMVTESEEVEATGGEIVIIPFVPDKSTTSIIERMNG